MFAISYQRMAINTPRLLDGKQEEIPTRCSTISYWTILAINFLAALVDSFMWLSVRYYTKL
jgi:hypothetical protein